MRQSLKSAIIGCICAGGLGGLSRADVTSIHTPPAGTNSSVQYNNRGQFAGGSDLTYSTTTRTLTTPALAVSTLTWGGFSYSPPPSVTGGYFLTNNGAGQTSWAAPTAVAITTGGALGVLDGSTLVVPQASSMTFQAAQFIVSLQGTTTAAVALNPSTVTLLGPLSGVAPVVLTGSAFSLDKSSVTLLGRDPVLGGALSGTLSNAVLGTVDISGKTNLAVSAPITLTGDTIGINKSSATLLGPSIEAAELPADGYAFTYVHAVGDTMTGPLTVKGSSMTATYNIAGGSLTARNLSNTLVAADANGVLISTTVVTGSGGGMSPGATYYVQIGETLQDGATFYVSSGTLNTSLVVGGYMNVNTSAGNLVINRDTGRIAIGTDGSGAPILGTENLTMGLLAGDVLDGTSIFNVALGAESLESCTTGFRNVAVGQSAMRFFDTGARNTAIGDQAGQIMLNSNDMVLVGANTGGSGSKSVALGVFANAACDNCGAIGYAAAVTTNNTMQIGGTGSLKMRVVMSSMTVSSGTVTTLATSDTTNRFGITTTTITVNGRATIQNTFPILSTSTLQSGATFYVSSGTVQNLTISTLQGVTPGLVAGTNITSITGTWPNQTINAATQAGGGGGSSALAIGLGSTTTFVTQISSPTQPIAFDISQFSGQLVGSTTGFITIAYSSFAATGSMSLSSTHTVVMANCGSACTMTLPSAAGISGKTYRVKVVGTGAVSIAASSSQNIDGASTITPNPNQWANIEVLSDGSNWSIQ